MNLLSLDLHVKILVWSYHLWYKLRNCKNSFREPHLFAIFRGKHSSRWKREFGGCVHLLLVSSLLQVWKTLVMKLHTFVKKDSRKVMTGIQFILAIATFPMFFSFASYTEWRHLHYTEYMKAKKKSYACVLWNRYMSCAILDILKIISLSLVPKSIIVVKMDYPRCYKIL